jgi:hypothetical protein
MNVASSDWILWAHARLGMLGILAAV